MAANAAIRAIKKGGKRKRVLVSNSQMTLRANLTIAHDGSVELPANMRAALGVPKGGKLLTRVEDGSLILEPIETAIKRAQEMVRRYIPDSVDIIEELMAERRAEAERE